MDMDKAAIYQAYASSPQIYVLNEPSSNLDKKAVNRIHHILAGMNTKMNWRKCIWS